MNENKLVVEVPLAERSYQIEIGTGNLPEIGRLLLARRHVSHAVVITDANVEPHHAMPAAESLAEAGMTVDLLVVEPGEASKCVEAAEGLWEKLHDLDTDRKSVIVAVGGGVVGDLAGFVAATYARGIDLVQVPTTLLAQVDSSVGGKVGINLPHGKNMVGAFWQPILVLIDTQVISTLPDRDFRAGLAEVVKYGVILDAEFFAYLEEHAAAIVQRDPAVLRQIIARSCQLKADVVANDEREVSGARAVLNYGHTFAHALESATGYGTLLHGEAVSIGMLCASRLAERLGRIDSTVTARQQTLLQKLGLPIDVPEVDHARLLQLMQHDKKTEHGRLRFVLPSRLGHVELVGDIDNAEVLAALAGGAT